MNIIVRVTIRSLVTLSLLLSVAGTTAFAETTQFAYGVNAGDWSLAQYRVNPETGALRHNGHLPFIKFPAALAVHPSRRFVVTVIKTPNKVAVHRIDANSGRLIEIPQSPFSVGAQSPYSVSIHPSGNFVYVAARWGGVVAFSMDQESGVLELVSGSPFAAEKRTRSLKVHPSGRFVYATNAHSNSISAYRVNERTGTLSPVSGSPFSTGAKMVVDLELMRIYDAPLESGGAPYRVEIHPSGRFIFVTNWMGLSLSVLRVDPDSGVLTPIDGSPFDVGGGGRPYAVAVHPSGQFVYVTSWDNHKVWGYGFDADKGQLVPVSGSPFSAYGYSPISISFNAMGNRAYVTNLGSNSITQFSVDNGSGQLSHKETLRTRYQPFDLTLFDNEPVDMEQPISFIVEDEKNRFRVLRMDAENSLRATQSKLKKEPLPGGGTHTVAVDPRGNYVYKAYDGGDKSENSGIAVYRVDTESGVLTFLPEYLFKLKFIPTDLVMDASGRYLYAVNPTINSLAVFVVDPDNGTLALPKSQYPNTGEKPVAIALDPAGRFSFVANAKDNTVSVFTHRRILSPAMYPINREGSAFSTGNNPVALAVDPTGKFLVVANRDSNDLSVFSIHFHEGKLEAVKGSPFASGKAPVSVVMHSGGKFVYVINAGSGDISSYRIDSLTGMLTKFKQRVDAGKHPVDIILGSEGRYAYVKNKGASVLRKYAVDTNSGLLTFSGEVASGLKVTVVH